MISEMIPCEVCGVKMYFGCLRDKEDDLAMKSHMCSTCQKAVKDAREQREKASP